MSDKPTLTLIRGLPGSGKTTLAKSYLVSGEAQCHFEADMYFEDFGYKFDPSKLKEAHEWCLQMTRHALDNNCDVVVANTFTRKWEMQPYIDLGYPTKIIVATGNFKNIHGVPDEAIERMRARWEEL